MMTVILVIHLLLALAMIAVVLLQRSEGGALGMGGGGGGGMGGFMTGRSAANMLTRTTAILAGAFMVTSLVLSLMASGQRSTGNLLDKTQDTPAATAPAPASEPAKPAEPAAPIAK